MARTFILVIHHQDNHYITKRAHSQAISITIAMQHPLFPSDCSDLQGSSHLDSTRTLVPQPLIRESFPSMLQLRNYQSSQHSPMCESASRVFLALCSYPDLLFENSHFDPKNWLSVPLKQPDHRFFCLKAMLHTHLRMPECEFRSTCTTTSQFIKGIKILGDVAEHFL